MAPCGIRRTTGTDIFEKQCVYWCQEGHSCTSLFDNYISIGVGNELRSNYFSMDEKKSLTRIMCLSITLRKKFIPEQTNQ